MRVNLAEVQYSVPAWVAHKAASEESAPETFTAERYAAVVMIVDVSGFTALGERLAAQGSEGAEILWRVVNAFFDRTLELIHAHGGDVLRFAGDAPIVIWRAQSESALAHVALRAAACGLALQSALGRYDTGEGAVIQFRVGIAVGDAIAARVGGLAGRWEAIVGGTPFEAVGLAAEQADVGQVVLSAAAGALLNGRADGERLLSGALRLKRLASIPPPVAIIFPELSLAALEALRRYVPRAVLDRLEAGHGRWLGELRRVTTVFVSIAGLDYRSEAIADRLHTLLRALQSAVYQYQGEINQFLVDDKGTVLLAGWGMPGSTHEGDPTRAVRAGLQIQRALAKLDLSCSIGISTGRIFCGVKGNQRRCEYGLLGAKVNLAARLSQKAQGEILVDADTQQGTQTTIAYAAPLSLRIKGHESLVPSFRVRHVLDVEKPRQSVMVARDHERSAILECLEAVLAGQGGALLIEGEAGIGKSKLLAFLREQAQERGFCALVGAADRIENQTPYCAFQPIFAELLGLEFSLDSAERVYKALDWFEKHAEWKPLAPLFNPVLRLALPDNATTAPMESEGRAETARNAFLQVLAKVRPLVVVIDDLQWLDSASWRLAQTVMRALPAALFVFAARPFSDESGTAHGELKQLENLRELQLSPLQRAEMDALVCAHLQASALAPPVSDALWQRASGYPFYAQELASALVETGAVELSGGIAVPRGNTDLSRVTLPPTLQGVIATRLDRLSPTAQLSLKTASVVGRSFGVAMVGDIYPVPEERSLVKPALEQTRKQELTVMEAAEPQLAYAFKHVITQEVAYENLLVEQRTALHRAAADWYESGKGGSVEPYYPLIAHHCECAREGERAIHALELAGEQALASCANREALSFMSKAYELDARGTPSPGLRRARWHRVMGLALSRLGMTTESFGHLARAVSLMGHPLPGTRLALAPALLVQIVRQLFRRYFGPPKPFANGSKVEARPSAREQSLDVVRTLGELGLIAWYRNSLPLMLYTTFKALNLAESVGSSPELSQIKASMASIMCGVAMQRAAQAYARESIGTATQFGHCQATVRAHQYVGAFLVSTGRWAEVQARADAARSGSISIGDERGVEEALNLEIYVDLYQARYAEVEAKAGRLGDSGRRRGDGQIVFWSAIHRAEIRWCQGLMLEAAQILDGMDPTRQADASIVGRYWGLRTHVLLGLGELDKARAIAETHLLPQKRPVNVHSHRVCTAVAELMLTRWQVHASESGISGAAKQACRQLEVFVRLFPMGQSSALYYEGRRLCLAGRLERGRARLLHSVEVAKARGERYEEMLARQALAQVSEGSDREHHREEAASLGKAISSGRSGAMRG